MTYPFFLLAAESREQDPYGPRYPGWLDWRRLSAVYLAPGTGSGNTAHVWFGGGCLQRILVSLDPDDFENHGYVNNHTPASGELVEFVMPTSLDAFNHYQWPGPPVARVLADMTGEGTLLVDVTGVRFLGLRLTSPLPSGGGYGYQVSCGLAVMVQFLPK